MLRVKLFLRDDSLPRTEFWQRLLDVLESSAQAGGEAEVLIPQEDTAIETNWPRYANPRSAYVRGQPHDLSDNGPFHRYVERIAGFARENPHQTVLYVNMHPFIRMPSILGDLHNVIVADVSLSAPERSANPRTISMPALPLVSGDSGSARPQRRILASFQGVNSHPVREQLAQIADGSSIVVNFVERSRHWGRLDATRGSVDSGYAQLLAESIFAFVPRGDALFSYRLAEVMSFGCIPVILSEGWVLPFDRTLPWSEMSLSVDARAISELPRILGSLRGEEIRQCQTRVAEAYRTHFSTLPNMVATMLQEAEHVLATMGGR